MASKSLGTLYVDFMARTGGLETDMGRASRIAKQRAKEIDKAIAATMRSVQQSATAIGVGVAAAVGAAAVAIKKSVDEMDQIGQTAQKIGVTTEALSALQYAAKLADVEAGALQGSLTRLAKTQADAAQGGKDQVEVFRLLDVEYKNVDGSLRKVDEVFADVADRFAGMEDGAEKTALAVKLLGRGGAELIPLMNEGADGLRRAREEAEAFGLIVSGEAAAAANEFNDNLDRMKSAMAGAAIMAATDLLPVMTDLSNQVVEMAKDPAFRGDLSNAIKVIGETSIATVQGVVALANGLGYLYDEARQLLGIIDDDDFVRWSEELDAARENLRKLKGEQVILPGPGEIAPIVIPVDDSAVKAAEAEVKRLEGIVEAALTRSASAASHLDAQRRAAEATRAVAESGAELDALLGTGKRAPPVLKDTAGADKAVSDAARAARQQAKEMADEQKQYTQVVRDLKLQALGDEARALAALQDQYGDLNRAVELSVVSQEEAAKIAAGLAEQWQKGATESIRVELLTDEQRAVEELQAKYISLQNQIATGAITPEMGVERAAGLAEKWAEEEAARYQSQIDSLSAGLLTEEELIAQSYGRRREEILNALDDESNAKLDRQKELNNLLYANEEAHQQAIADLERQRAHEKLDLWGQAFGNLATLMGSENKKLFEIGKAAAIAEAVVNVAQGVTEALSMGPIIGPILAATVAAAGAVQIGTIASQEPRAYDVGGTIPSGVVGLVAERGPELVSLSAAHAVIDAARVAPEGMDNSGIHDRGADKAVEAIHAGRVTQLVSEPTFIEGPAQITSRLATARLLQDDFAGYFDLGGRIAAGKFGMVGENGPELVAGPATITSRVNTTALMERASDRESAPRKPDKHIHVWSEKAAAEAAMNSGEWERVVIHHANRNRSTLGI